MPKILRDNKAVLTVVGVVVGLAMTFLSLTNDYLFYSKQDGISLKADIKANDELINQKVDTHIETAKEIQKTHNDIQIQQFKDINEKLNILVKELIKPDGG